MYLRHDDANQAAHDEREAVMNIMPTRIQEQINRVDHTRALVIGISAGLTALWSIYRLFWLVYTATTLSSVGWSPVSLVFPFVLWGAIGVVAAFVSIAFLVRYA
jgi:predicted peptidase